MRRLLAYGGLPLVLMLPLGGATRPRLGPRVTWGTLAAHALPGRRPHAASSAAGVYWTGWPPAATAARWPASSLGFEDVGTYRRVGWGHGAWHDVTWLQRDLGTGPPGEPR